MCEISMHEMEVLKGHRGEGAEGRVEELPTRKVQLADGLYQSWGYTAIPPSYPAKVFLSKVWHTKNVLQAHKIRHVETMT